MIGKKGWTGWSGGLIAMKELLRSNTLGMWSSE